MNLVFKALADPGRRKILHLLRARNMTAGEIAEHFQLAKPTLSRHFAVLREADLIHGDKNGTSITYSLNVSVLEEALLGLMNAMGFDAKENGNDSTTQT
ncbi:MAG: autorepressor SdpR family transcription factor [Candidatus Hydrogenedentes bacterium]|nr:autorepressor SdpR family transcription factor [Candidatus Hydrogenedentota bacterium]